jgi:hypoxanthine-guanine phosphoribosyltransferase
MIKNNTAERIIEYIKGKKQATANELSLFLGISRQALSKHLNRFIAEKILVKSGRPPKVFYLLAEIKENINYSIDYDVSKKIDENYLIITPAGEFKEGVEGFVYWCEKNKLDPVKTANEYVKTLAKYEAFKKDGLISGKQKFVGTFEQVNLDKIFYLDFYSIERFGKTKLGQLLLYAKQSQDRGMIKKLIENISPRIVELIENFQIDAVGFVPPTIKREIQFMKELQRGLALNLRILNIIKVKTPVIVPQKSLSNLADRIENAKKSIIIEDDGKYRNILLIDDAVGSGATLNETAGQIRSRGLVQGKIIGLAITGSFKGFEVISEV